MKTVFLNRFCVYAMTTQSVRLFLESYLWVMRIQYLVEITSVRAAIELLCAGLSLTKKESMWTKSFKEISNCILNPKKHTLRGRILAELLPHSAKTQTMVIACHI